MVPSSELVAREEYCGWKARAVMLALCPLSSNLAGVTGMYASSDAGSAGPFLGAPLVCSFRLAIYSSSLLTFFCNESMDFHLSYSLLPSGSTSARLQPISYASFSAVAVRLFFTRYSRMSLLSCCRWDWVNIKFNL